MYYCFAKEEDLVAAEHWCEGVLVHDDEVRVRVAGVYEVRELSFDFFSQEPFAVEHGVRHEFNSRAYRADNARNKIADRL